MCPGPPTIGSMSAGEEAITAQVVWKSILWTQRSKWPQCLHCHVSAQAQQWGGWGGAGCAGGAIIHHNHSLSLGESPTNKKLFFGRSLPNLFTHPPTPGFLWDLGKRKVKYGSKKGFGPCLGISHPTHIWERFPKKNGFLSKSMFRFANTFWHLYF